MKLILLALALQATTPSQPQPRLQDLPQAPQGPGNISPAHDLYFEESNRFASRTTPAARRALHDFAGCVTRHNGRRAGNALRLDFTSRHYRDELNELAQSNDACVERVDYISASGLPFAGALAEHLLAGDPTPLNVRLARAAALPAVHPYSPTDRMALCVVRSVPDDIARLLATELGSDAEAQALRALEVPARACAQGGPRLEIAPVGLRAMFAAAAYRTVAGRSAEARN